MKWLSAAVLAACTVLSACGGGGGGDGGSPAARTSLNVTGPARLDVDVYEGQTMPDLVINGTMTGDVGSLAGRTVYLVAEVPHNFLYGSVSAHLSSDGRSGNLQLFGATVPDGVRTYTGNIVVHACLDSACSSAIPVSNSNIPYTVRVHRGLHVDSEHVAMSTTFGTPTPEATVAVTLPENLSSWEIKPSATYSVWTVVQPRKAVGTNAVVFAVPEQTLPTNPANPFPDNTYAVVVEALTTDGARLYKIVEVTVTTLPSSLPFAFQRPRADFRVSLSTGGGGSISAGVLFPGNDSDRWEYLGIDYTVSPAGANLAILPPYGWAVAYMQDVISSPRRADQDFPVSLTAEPCSNGACLPVGHYEAVIRYRYTPAGGAARAVNYPVTLELVP